MPFISTIHTLQLYYDFLQSNTRPSASIRTVLLLHGFAGTASSDFAAQIPLLQRRYNVIAPHLHGYGRSSHRSAYPPSYYRDDAADMVALLDAHDLPNALVLAFSDGAIVAVLLAALYPERVAALATLGAQSSLTAGDVVGIRQWLLEKPLSDEWMDQLTQLHGDPYWRTLLAHYVAGQEALLAQGNTLISDEELAHIRCPVLIMHGARDRIVSVDYAYALHARIAHAQLLLFDAGHPAHLRCEEAFNEAVLSFFAKQTSI